MHGIQHLNVMHLRGRAAGKTNSCDDDPEQEPVKGNRRSGEEPESEIAGSGNGNGEKKANEGLKEHTSQPKRSKSAGLEGSRSAG